MKGEPILAVIGVHAGYAGKRVLHDVTLNVNAGEIVALCGANGAGKSTLLKAIFGLLPLDAGVIRVGGSDLGPLTARQRLSQGIVYVPQGNRVFEELSVEDNMAVCDSSWRSRGNDGAAMALRAIGARPQQSAGTLSGGERQMLALAMALVRSPRILLLDEPSLGLSPRNAQAVFEHLVALRAATGITFVIVEQRVRLAIGIADRVCVLRLGKVSYCGSPSALDNPVRMRALFF